MNWKLAGDIAYTILVVFNILFVGFYGLFSPWYRNETGRNIMGVMGTLCILLTYFGWVIWRGTLPPAALPVRAIGFGTLAFFVGQRFILLLNAHIFTSLKDDPKENRDEDTRQVDRDAAGDASDGSDHGVSSGER